MTEVYRILGCAIVLAAVVCMLLLTLRELRAWQKQRTIIPLRQVIVRALAGLLIMLLLVQILGGILFVRAEADGYLYFVIYWLGCLGLALLVALVAVVDFFLVLGRRRQVRRNLHETAIDLCCELARDKATARR